jgi:hypothetical protein
MTKASMTRVVSCALLALGLQAGCGDDGTRHATDDVRTCTLAVEECAAEEYCNFTDGTCGQGPGSALVEGRCTLRCGDGCVCIQIVQPVCGCDRHTYTSPCHASRAGVAVAHHGPCACGNGLCALGTICCNPEAGICAPPGSACALE